MVTWKHENISNMENGKIIVYFCKLGDKTICEATAKIDENIFDDKLGVIDSDTVYLEVFRTLKIFQGIGYFSKLFNFMVTNLKNKSYIHATIGVELNEVKNMMIYFKYGLNEFVKINNDYSELGHEALKND